MKIIRYILMICIGLNGTSITFASIDLLAEPGMPAAGFPSNFVYQSVKNPVIGKNGHIAFTGTADTGLTPSVNNTIALWSGLPDQLRIVIKEGDIPFGLSQNFVVDSITGNTVYVTSSGIVVFMAGSSTPANETAIIAQVNGNIIGILKTGDQVPGLAGGVTIAGVYNFSTSDAGVAITVPTSNGEVVLLFWDFQSSSLSLVAAPSLDVSSLYPGCSYAADFPALLDAKSINDAGDIVYWASFAGAGSNCPVSAIVKWNQGQLSEIANKDDLVPGMPSNILFGSLGRNGNLQVNDAGDVTFFTSLVDQVTSVQYNSYWLARKNGQLELILLEGEILPGDSGELVNNVMSFAHANASSKVAIRTNSDTGVRSLLTGSSKTSFSYSDITNVGKSHLNLLTNSNDQPDGFGITWYFDALNYHSPLINNKGEVAIFVDVIDSLDVSNSAITGIWKGTDVTGLKLIVAEGGAVTVNSVSQTLTLIDIVSNSSSMNGGSTNSGHPIQMSDSGQIIFMGARTGSAQGPGAVTSMFVTQLPPNQDIVIDFGGIGLWARMNDSSWQKLNNSSPDDVITGDVDGNGIGDVIADFGSTFGGIFIKRNGGSWVKLHNNSPLSMATGDLDGNGKDDIIIDFGSIGLWARMNDTTWLKLNNSSPDQFVITDMDGNESDDVIADYGTTFGGLFVKRNLGGWSKLHNTSPVTMTSGDLDGNGSGDVIINFGGIGLWARMNNTSWTKLSNGSPDSIVAGDVDGNGADDVIASFGSTIGGVWQKLNLGGWSKLNNNAPDQMVMGDLDANGQSDLIGAFNSTLGGIFVRRNNDSWQKLHNSNPDDLAVGDLDGN